jgi:hypothetical protein
VLTSALWELSGAVILYMFQWNVSMLVHVCIRKVYTPTMD